jgi:CBS domain-containing protein
MRHHRIYREQVELADAREGVREAARRMRERRVGALVIVDDRGHPIGIVTDRDLAIRVLGEDRAVAATHVGDVMTPNPVVVSEDTSTESLLALMTTRPRTFRRLPVVDSTGRVVGVVSIDDVLAHIAAELAAIAAVLGRQTPFILDGLTREDVEAGLRMDASFAEGENPRR